MAEMLINRHQIKGLRYRLTIIERLCEDLTRLGDSFTLEEQTVPLVDYHSVGSTLVPSTTLSLLGLKASTEECLAEHEATAKKNGWE